MNALFLYKIITIIHLRDVIYRHKIIFILGLFFISYLGIFTRFLFDYFITDFTIWTSLFLSFFIIKPNISVKGNYKYLWLSLIFLLLTMVTGIQTFFFIALGFGFLFSIECFAGNIGHLPFFLIGLLSPTFRYFNNMLGFPVRLKLSEWAGVAIQYLGYKIEVTGNVLLLNGTEFAVDPACVGLKMMAFSFLTGLFIMAFFERQRNESFSFISAFSMLLLIAGLNIISNFLRIMILTIFTILPENQNHDIIGVICFLVYVILPSYFMIKWTSQKIKYRPIVNERSVNNLKKKTILTLTLILTLAITGFVKIKPPEKQTFQPSSISIKGYSREIIKGDIVKLEKPGILIYIKSLPRFYGAEHNPMICWIGSGYEFNRINTKIIGGFEIYTGILIKGSEKLYTAWWFDSTTFQTINQAEWRWRAFKGETFCLVNISSENEDTLHNEIVGLVTDGLEN